VHDLGAHCASDPVWARNGTSMVLITLVVSLLQRLRRGEGMLVLVAVALGAARGARGLELSALAVFSSVLLATLYAWNDLADCEHDLRDPGKDHAYAHFLATHRGALVARLVATQALLVLAATVALGPASAAAATVAISVNAAYSWRLKGVAGLDLACGPLWGGAIAAVAAPVPWRIVALVGLMTTVCHLYQTRRDLRADAANGIATTVTARPTLAGAVLIACCVAMALLLPAGDPWWRLVVAAVPALLWWSPLPNQVAWLLGKGSFGLAFVCGVLGELHGAATITATDESVRARQAAPDGSPVAVHHGPDR